jgi:hypothetical protein
VSNAQEGRAAFHTMIQGFEGVTRQLASVAAQHERSAAAIETLVQQNEVMAQQNRDLMQYSAALQQQIGVLCDLIASQNGVQHSPLPAMNYQQQPGVGQRLVQGMVNGFMDEITGGGRSPSPY